MKWIGFRVNISVWFISYNGRPRWIHSAISWNFTIRFTKRTVSPKWTWRMIWWYSFQHRSRGIQRSRKLTKASKACLQIKSLPIRYTFHTGRQDATSVLTASVTCDLYLSNSSLMPFVYWAMFYKTKWKNDLKYIPYIMNRCLYFGNGGGRYAEACRVPRG